MNLLLENQFFIKLFFSLLTMLIGFFTYHFVSMIFLSKIEKGKFKLFQSKKSKTYLKLFKNINAYFISFVVIIIILRIYGVNVSSMLAGVGIVGIVIGFAIQDALKDIIKGIDILSDSYYDVGDVISFKGVVGKVLSIGLKTTKVSDVNTNNIVSISNRNIEQVEVVSNLININVPMPYEIKLKEAVKIISEMVVSLKKDDNIIDAEYRGIQELGDSAIYYQIKVYCDPVIKTQVRRDSLTTIFMILESHNISVPYQQVDIHQKK